MGLDGGKVSNTGKVHDFLYGMAGQHWDTGLTNSIYVRVVTENVQRTACKGTSRNVKYNWKVFTEPICKYSGSSEEDPEMR